MGVVQGPADLRSKNSLEGDGVRDTIKQKITHLTLNACIFNLLLLQYVCMCIIIMCNIVSILLLYMFVPCECKCYKY